MASNQAVGGSSPSGRAPHRWNRKVLQAQACYYIATGVSPLLSRRWFEAATGPKQDWWLVQMVGLLAATNGVAIWLGARGEEASHETIVLSVLSAFSFATIDVVYVTKRRISPVYLIDAAIEAAIVAALSKMRTHGHDKKG